VSDGEDLVSRARSIFARLRDDVEEEPEEAAPEPSTNGVAALETVSEPPAEGSEAVEPEPEREPPEPISEPEPPAPERVEAPVEEAAPVLGEAAPAAVLEETEPALPDRLVEPEEIPEPAPPAVEAEAPSDRRGRCRE
jgi:hypothetical protein